MDKISKMQILEYEVSSSWWACYISNKYLQNIAGSYFAWKVKRKYKKYLRSLDLTNLNTYQNG